MGLITAFASGERRRIRGVPGFAGTSFPAAPPDHALLSRVWGDHGTITVVTAKGIPEAALDQAVEDLRPLDPKALPGLAPTVARSCPAGGLPGITGQVG
jgi:hypothetical protein